MLEAKSLVSYKLGVVLLLAAAVLVFIISRNTHAITKAFVSQEIKWNTADFEQYETQHFQIKYLPVDRKYVNVIGETAEDAYKKAELIFAHTPDSKTTIIIYPDTSSLAKSFGWEKDEKAMGVYWGGTIRILSPHEWIEEKENWQSTFISKGPIYHEYSHLIVDDISKGNYSRWFTEGVAQYVEKKITGFEFNNPFINRDFSYYQFEVLNKEFDELDQQIAYWQSLQIIEYLVENYGEESIIEILHCLGTGKSLEKSISEVLHISYREFESNFYESLDNIQS